MRRHRSVGRLCVLLVLCIFCVVVMKVLAFDSRDADAGGDKGEETIVGWMIDRIAAGEVELSDEDSIRQAIDEGEKEFGISLTEENRDRVIEFLKTLEQADDTINGAFRNAAKDAVRSFFQSLLSKKDE